MSGENEPTICLSDDWYTPPEIFAALGLVFDLDPCSPGATHWVPARKVFTKEDDGLKQPWQGLVFVNPPFGGRHEHIPWLSKFIDYGNGVAIFWAYTSSGWWHDWIPRVHSVLFPRGKDEVCSPGRFYRRLARARRRAARHG